MKKRLKLEFLPIAEEDITEIVDFIAEDKISAALNFYEKLEGRFEQLRAYPHLGVKRKEPELELAGYYSLLHGNYIIFYTIETNTIVIHRVLNTHREYLRFLK